MYVKVQGGVFTSRALSSHWFNFYSKASKKLEWQWQGWWCNRVVTAAHFYWGQTHMKLFKCILPSHLHIFYKWVAVCGLSNKLKIFFFLRRTHEEFLHIRKGKINVDFMRRLTSPDDRCHSNCSFCWYLRTHKSYPNWLENADIHFWNQSMFWSAEIPW